jgi:hypothetical protein
MKARQWGKGNGGIMLRRLVVVPPFVKGRLTSGKLECGHSTCWRDRVQRCDQCEGERKRVNGQKR